MNKFIMFTNKKEKGDVDVSITTLNENRKTNVHLVFYSVSNRMVMVNLPSLRSPGISRLMSSINILHVLKILKFDNMQTFDTLVTKYFSSSDESVHRKLLDLLCVNKVNFAAHPDSMEIFANLLSNSSSMTKEQKEAAVMSRIQRDVFSHLSHYFGDMDEIETMKYRNSNKIHILAYCTAMLLENQAGIRSDTCRDSWSNKRIEAASKAMEYLQSWHTLPS